MSRQVQKTPTQYWIGSNQSANIYVYMELARRFLNGDGLPKNSEEGAKWVRRAAELDWPPAEYTLARLLHDGEGVPRDFEQAFMWAKKAADQRYLPAESLLAEMYSSGEGVSQDFTGVVQF